MHIIEALMVALVVSVCTYSSYTDIKNGVIKNRMLVIAATISLAFNILYYAVFAGSDFIGYLLNFAITATISVGLYCSDIWAAGDSKLLIYVMFSLPYRVYLSGGITPAIVIIMLTFATAFVYYLIESVVLSFKKRNSTVPSMSLNRLFSNLLSFVKNYIVCSVYLLLFNKIIYIIDSSFIASNEYLITLSSVLLVIFIFRWKLYTNIFVVFGAIAVYVALSFWSGNFCDIISTFSNPWKWIILAIVICLRNFAGRDNYETISTENVKKGMILSVSTVVKLNSSRVVGLPKTTTEDMRSRITEDEAAAIKRWSCTKKGEPYINVVRKVPFAIFISLGLVLYLIFRMWYNV